MYNFIYVCIYIYICTRASLLLDYWRWCDFSKQKVLLNEWHSMELSKSFFIFRLHITQCMVNPRLPHEGCLNLFPSFPPGTFQCVFPRSDSETGRNDKPETTPTYCNFKGRREQKTQRDPECEEVISSRHLFDSCFSLSADHEGGGGGGSCAHRLCGH